MKRIWRRTIVSGLLAMLALGTPGLGATPATAQTAQDKGPATFGVRPATAQAPDNRPNFSYSATPGAVMKDHLAVANISNDPLTLKVYASDAFNTADGGFDLLDSGHKPVDVGTWSKVDGDSGGAGGESVGGAGGESVTVVVPGRTTKIVPFTITVPQNATPGDHAGGIVAALVTEAVGSDGQRVAVEQRVGARIYLRISGELRPSLSIEDVHAEYHAPFFGVTGETKVSYTIRNGGNVRLGGRQKVDIATPWGSSTAAPKIPDLPELLPGSTFQVTTTVAGLLPAGWLDGTVHVDPVAPPGPQPQAVATDADFTVIAVPWLALSILGLVLVLTLYLLWRKRRRKARAGATPDPQPEVEHAVA